MQQTANARRQLYKPSSIASTHSCSSCGSRTRCRPFHLASALVDQTDGLIVHLASTVRRRRHPRCFQNHGHHCRLTDLATDLRLLWFGCRHCERHNTSSVSSVCPEWRLPPHFLLGCPATAVLRCSRYSGCRTMTSEAMCLSSGKVQHGDERVSRRDARCCMRRR